MAAEITCRKAAGALRMAGVFCKRCRTEASPGGGGGLVWFVLTKRLGKGYGIHGDGLHAMRTEKTRGSRDAEMVTLLLHDFSHEISFLVKVEELAHGVLALSPGYLRFQTRLGVQTGPPRNQRLSQFCRASAIIVAIATTFYS